MMLYKSTASYPRPAAVLLLVLILWGTSCGGSSSPTQAPPTITPEPTAQVATTCPALVQQALDAVDTACQNTGRNQVCYGNISLTAQAREGASSFTFDSPGDLANLGSIQSLRLSSMDIATQAWGVALMRVQANLPDTVPGQNLTFLLFGDVQLENEGVNDGVQSFYFQSGVGDAPCAEAPESGILIQTPQGAGLVSFRLNDVDISLGSTAYVQAQPDSDLTFSVVEGQAQVTAQGVTEIVPAGNQTRVQLDAEGKPAAPPTLPQPYTRERVRQLPIVQLERQITIASVELSSQFIRNAEDWLLYTSGTRPAHFSAGSTSDGYICSTASEPDWYFRAPPAWRGSRGNTYGGTLDFTLRQSRTDDQEDRADAILIGGGIRLEINIANNPGQDWTAYSIPLDENGGWINIESNAPPTRDEMLTVLSSLTDVLIRGGFRRGSATGCLDSAQMTVALTEDD